MPTHSQTFELQSADNGLLTFQIETEVALQYNTPVPGRITVTSSNDPLEQITTFVGMFIVDRDTKVVRYLEGHQTCHSKQGILMGESLGTFDKGGRLDSFIYSEDNPKTCEVKLYTETGSLSSVQTGVFVNGVMKDGEEFRYPSPDDSDAQTHWTYFKGKPHFRSNPLAGNAAHIVHSPDCVFLVKRKDETFHVHFGLYENTYDPIKYVVTLDGQAIQSIRMESFDNEGSSIWTARTDAPNQFHVDCPHAYALTAEALTRLIQRIIRHLIECKGIDTGSEDNVSVALLENQAYPAAKKRVTLFDNDVGTLLQGELDTLGRLNGYAEIDEIHCDDKKIKIKGQFAKHHFLEGEVTYTYSNGSIHTFTVPGDKNALGELNKWCPATPEQHTTIQVNIVRHGDHHIEMTTPQNTVVTEVITQTSRNCQMTYTGFMRNGRYQGMGEKITKRTSDSGETFLQIQTGPFDEGYLDKGGTIETTIDESAELTHSVFKLGSALASDVESYTAMETKTTTYKDGKTPAIKETKEGLFQDEFLVKGTMTREQLDGQGVRTVERGNFNSEQRLHNHQANKETMQRQFFKQDKLLATEEGYFTDGHLTSGKRTRPLKNITEYACGKFKRTETPHSDDDYLSTLLHDISGILFQDEPSKNRGMWQQGFKDGQSSAPRYDLVYNKARQLIKITLPGHWSITRNDAGEEIYQSLQARSNNTSQKKQLEKQETDAQTKFSQIELSLIELGSLSRFQSTVTLSDLVLAEEEEKKKKKTQKSQTKSAEKEKKLEDAKRLSEKKQEAALRKANAERLEREQHEARVLEQQAHVAALQEKRSRAIAASLQALSSNTLSDPILSNDTQGETPTRCTPESTQNAPTQAPQPKKTTTRTPDLSYTITDALNHLHQIKKWIQPIKPNDPNFTLAVQDHICDLDMHFDYNVVTNRPLIQGDVFQGHASLSLSSSRDPIYTYLFFGDFMCTASYQDELCGELNFKLIKGHRVKIDYLTDMVTEETGDFELSGQLQAGGKTEHIPLAKWKKYQERPLFPTQPAEPPKGPGTHRNGFYATHHPHMRVEPLVGLADRPSKTT